MLGLSHILFSFHQNCRMLHYIDTLTLFKFIIAPFNLLTYKSQATKLVTILIWIHKILNLIFANTVVHLLDSIPGQFINVCFLGNIQWKEKIPPSQNSIKTWWECWKHIIIFTCSFCMTIIKWLYQIKFAMFV